MFERLIEQTMGLGGADGDLLVITLTALMLFMIGTYLLITRGSGWHVAVGLTLNTIAALYLLAVADIITVESIWNGELLTKALQFVGLG